MTALEHIASLEPSGLYYQLPDGWTFADMARHRAKWDIPLTHTVIGSVNGLVAWGTLLESDYRQV